MRRGQFIEEYRYRNEKQLITSLRTTQAMRKQSSKHTENQ